MTRFEADLTIEAIGPRGDGIATVDGRTVFVPFTAAGDQVRVRLDADRDGRLRGRPVELLVASPDRAEPACVHFGTCGGCALQHLSPAAYGEWKLQRLLDDLARHGIADPPLTERHAAAPGSRRRADFTAIRRRGELILGFNERGSHRVIDITACPVVRPEIAALLLPLRDTLRAVLREGASAECVVTLTDSGLDLLVSTAADIGRAGRDRLVALAEEADLARVSRGHPRGRGAEPVVVRRRPTMRFGRADVEVPPGAFLQATADGEAALAEVVIEATREARRVIDLFAGCGTFSLPVASLDAKRVVHAVDASRSAIEALARAARAVPLPRVTADARNLVTRPLPSGTLDAYDAAILDPPRAGALDQTEQIARSRVPTVVYVSCNPRSFARDASLLIEAGYELVALRPVDQFLWSPHLELAAVLLREE